MDEQELSGRELDAAVAEHVFGWKWLTIQGEALCRAAVRLAIADK